MKKQLDEKLAFLERGIHALGNALVRLRITSSNRDHDADLAEIQDDVAEIMGIIIKIRQKVDTRIRS